MIKEFRIMEEIQAIRRVIMAPECDSRAKAREKFFDYIKEKHNFASQEELKKSELYKSMIAWPAMKHILEYLEL